MASARGVPTWLSKAELRVAATLIDLAKLKGAKSIVVYGATINFPRPAPGVPAANTARDLRSVLQERKAHQEQAATMESNAQPASKRRKKKSARQLQRSADRLQKKVADMRERLLHCKLRKVLLRAMKMRRWQHTQSVWTEWMRSREPAAAPEVRMLEAPKPAEKRPAMGGPSASHASSSQGSDDEDADREVHHRRLPRAERDRQLMPPPPPPAKGGRARGTKRDAKRARGGGKGAFSVGPDGICSRDGRIINGQPSGYLRAPL